MRFRLSADDVRIWACTVAVVGTDPVVVERIRSQTGNVSASRIANIQILVSGYIGSERSVQSDIEAITSRTTNTAPITGKTSGSNIGRA